MQLETASPGLPLVAEYRAALPPSVSLMATVPDWISFPELDVVALKLASVPNAPSPPDRQDADRAQQLERHARAPSAGGRAASVSLDRHRAGGSAELADTFIGRAGPICSVALPTRRRIEELRARARSCRASRRP